MNAVRRARYDEGWIEDRYIDWLKVCSACGNDMKPLIYQPKRERLGKIWFCGKCTRIYER